MKMPGFGPRLYHARKQMHLSAPQFAELIDVDPMMVYRYEKGESMPSFATAIRIANLFQISLDELANGREVPERPPSFRNQGLLERMRALDELPPERQELAARMLDAVMAGELDAIVRRLRGE